MRMALGAKRGQVLRLVMRQGGRLAVERHYAKAARVENSPFRIARASSYPSHSLIAVA
jgi:hypothetical protein